MRETVPNKDHPDVGDLLRYWRHSRGMSQMELAHAAGISPRHMSFVETGRSTPSREVLLRLAGQLDVPLREENALLEAAGHARRYRRSSLDGPRLEQVRKVLRFLLDRHEPNSALVFDGAWDIVMSNEAHRRSLDFFLAGRKVAEEVRGNLLRLVFHPDALRRCLVNWHIVGPVVLQRAEAELRENPSARELADLTEEVRGYGPVPPAVSRNAIPPELLLPIHLRRGAVDVRLFSVIGTIGAPTDITLQELRIETFFPADEESEEALGRMMGADADGG